MNLKPYAGFESIADAINTSEALKLSRDVVVVIRFMGQFYVVACQGVDRSIVIGPETTFRKSWKDGTFKCQPTSEFTSWYKIKQREPRRYTDTIYQELKSLDPEIALFTVNAAGTAREIAAASNVNYPVILGLTFKRVLVPIEQLPNWGVSYFKDSHYLTEAYRQFHNTRYTHVNPFLGIAYNPKDPEDFILYGFTHRSERYGVRYDDRRPTDYEIFMLADSIQLNPAQPTPQEVLQKASKPMARIYQFPTKPFYARKGR